MPRHPMIRPICFLAVITLSLMLIGATGCGSVGQQKGARTSRSLRTNEPLRAVKTLEQRLPEAKGIKRALMKSKMKSKPRSKAKA